MVKQNVKTYGSAAMFHFHSSIFDWQSFVFVKIDLYCHSTTKTNVIKLLVSVWDFIDLKLANI